MTDYTKIRKDMKEGCEHCYEYVGENEEHITVPIRDLGFLVLNLWNAFILLEENGHVFDKEEKKTMNKLWEVYAPPIHYNSSGRFYDMPEEEHKKFKFKHKSYM